MSTIAAVILVIWLAGVVFALSLLFIGIKQEFHHRAAKKRQETVR